MGEVIAMYPNMPDWRDEELDQMDIGQLRDCLKTVNQALAVLDEREPADMESEAYDRWADRHEALEDLADELFDRLEDLGAAPCKP